MSGRVAERPNAPVLKTGKGGFVLRGFESHPFRQKSMQMTIYPLNFPKIESARWSLTKMAGLKFAPTALRGEYAKTRLAIGGATNATTD